MNSLPSLVIALVISLLPARGALMINLDFSNFGTGAPANGDPILGGATLAQAQDVIQTAADYWEAVFANSSSGLTWAVDGNLTQDIDVLWGAKTNPTLATGGPGSFYMTGEWASGGSLTFDNDGDSFFYVDTTPTEQSEWNQSSTSRTLNFGGGDMNVERVWYDAPAGVVRDNHDMLTIAIHEIGHALGWVDGYSHYDNADVGGDGDIDITSGPFKDSQIEVHGSHTEFEIPTPSTEYPYDPGGSSYFPITNYGPNVMGPSISAGTRKLLTEADIAIVAEYLDFEMSTVNFSPTVVPEPSSLLLGGALSFLCFRRRRAHHQR